MLKNDRALALIYNGGASAGTAVLRTDGSILVEPYRGVKFVIEGVAQAVLEENAAYLAWRESQGGTPGVAPPGEEDDINGGEYLAQDDDEGDHS